MEEYFYDVTKPDQGISVVQVSSGRSRKIIYFLSSLLFISIGAIVYISFFTESCYYEGKHDTHFRNVQTTTEAIITTGLGILESTSKLALNKTDDNLDNLTCQSSECLHTAAHVLSSMDLTRAPCDNFYEYACGRKDSPTEELPNIFDQIFKLDATSPKFLKKFRTFYETCVTHEDKFDYNKRLNGTKILLKRVGSFQAHGEKKNNSSITKLITSLILLKAMPLFDIDIDINEDSTYILKLIVPDQTSLEFKHWSPLTETKRDCLRKIAERAHGKSLNLSELYQKLLLCQKNYADYLDLISTSILELGAFSKDKAKSEILGIRVFIEFKILPIFDRIPLPPNVQEQNTKRQYKEMKIKELKKEYPILDWEYLLGLIGNKSISSDSKILLYNKDYFDEIFECISNVSHDFSILNNALLAILATSLYVNTVLPSHRHTRVEYCEERSREVMPDITNYLYKQAINTEHLNKQNADIRVIYDDLKETFRNSLQNREWLENSTKTSMLEKLDKIRLFMFKNDDIESEKQYLEQTYDEIVLQTNNYQYNLFNLIEFRERTLFALNGKKVSEENIYRHFVGATEEEPPYFYASDIACIPYALAGNSLDKLPKYMVLARVGFKIARVIGRAFDRIGIGYGLNLTEDAATTYEYFADQTRDMMDLSNPIEFEKKKLNFKLNNDLSESERIADNTAMRLLTESFRSFQNESMLPWISRDFSKEKFFFLFLAQGLCRKMDIMKFMLEAYESPVLPPQLRIQSMLSNSQEFSDMFGCLPGSGMNPSDDRLQFPYL